MSRLLDVAEHAKEIGGGVMLGRIFRLGPILASFFLLSCNFNAGELCIVGSGASELSCAAGEFIASSESGGTGGAGSEASGQIFISSPADSTLIDSEVGYVDVTGTCSSELEGLSIDIVGDIEGNPLTVTCTSGAFTVRIVLSSGNGFKFIQFNHPLLAEPLRLSVEQKFCVGTKATATENFAGGEGSSALPYLICNVYQLQLIGDASKHPNGAAGLQKYYMLADDIDASPTFDEKDVGESVFNPGGFTPIGTCADSCFYPDSNVPFTGSFDGNAYKISNLYMNRTDPQVGLFGFVDTGAVITNFSMIDPDITKLNLSGGGAPPGGGGVGAAIGVAYNNDYYNYNDISTRTEVSKIKVEGGSIKGGESGGNPTYAVGGVIGYSRGSYTSEGYNIDRDYHDLIIFSDLSSNLTINGHATYVAGIIGGGLWYGEMRRSFSKSTITNTLAYWHRGGYYTWGAGGLIGWTCCDALIEDSYFDGSIEADAAQFIGGITSYGGFNSIFQRVFLGPNAKLKNNNPNGLSAGVVGYFWGDGIRGNEIKDSFSVGYIYDTLDDSGVTYEIVYPVYGGGLTLENNHWLDVGESVSGCFGSSNPAGECDLDPGPLSGFFSATHPVYSGWSFGPGEAWQTLDGTGLPKLNP